MSDVSRRLEAILLLATEPAPAADLAAAVGEPVEVVERELAALAEFYQAHVRGFELRRSGGGWRYRTHPDLAGFLDEWATAGASAPLSKAALETLAVIAYLQPVARGRVAAVRGVNVDGVVRTLTTRGMVETLETDPRTGAALFTTTAAFLEALGVDSLDALPDLAPELPDALALEAELAGLAAERVGVDEPTGDEPAEGGVDG